MPENGINSINYNAGAAVALNDLNITATGLQTTYNAVSTGKLINGPATNPAIWATAQRSGSDISALDAVVQSIQRNQSVNDVAVSAGQQIVDLLNQLKAVVTTASDGTTDAASRAECLTQFKSLVQQINNTANSATFNGVNLLNTAATGFFALANASGTMHVTITPKNLTIQQGVAPIAGGFTFTAGAGFASAASATTLLAAVNTSVSNITSDVAALGTNSTNLSNQLTMVQTLQQGLQGGVSNLVDADMAKESAQLQALQAKQQLGVPALSIANASKSQLLNLFK